MPFTNHFCNHWRAITTQKRGLKFLFLKISSLEPGRGGGSCAWSALEREGLGELRQHLLFRGCQHQKPELAVHTQLQTSHCFICLQMQSFGGLRDINPQNHSSLVHLFLEWLFSSSMNQELVLSTVCYNSTKHRQQLVTPDIPPAFI